MEYDAYLERIAARATGRYDVPSLFSGADVLSSVVDDFADPFRGEPIELVAGVDALGFVLGTGVALELGTGFLPIRKGGKLSVPESDIERRQVEDYSDERKTLEVDTAAVPDGASVLVVDDWMETAAQMTAATELVAAAGGEVAGIVVLDAESTEQSRRLAETYRVHAVNPETTFEG